MAASQDYYVWVPLRGGHPSCHLLWNSPRTSFEKSYLFSFDNKKNVEFYVNMTILARSFTIARLKIVAATFRKMKDAAW